MRTPVIAACALLVITSACTLVRNYKRPAVATPDQFYNAAPVNPEAAAETTSLGDEVVRAIWRSGIADLWVRTALAQSLDIRIAASRILRAQEQVGITRAGEFPAVTAGPDLQVRSCRALRYLLSTGLWSRGRPISGAGAGAPQKLREPRGFGQMEPARNSEARIVESVAAACFQMRELDTELEISEQTLASRRQSLALTQTLLNGEATRLLGVRQPDNWWKKRRRRFQIQSGRSGVQEDLISTLIGENPHAIPRSEAFTERRVPPEVPIGHASRLLGGALTFAPPNSGLAAATADIRVARAQLFPSLAITGGAGTQSANFARLFSGPGAGWTTASFAQPIFNAGALPSNVRLSEAQQQRLVLT